MDDNLRSLWSAIVDVGGLCLLGMSVVHKAKVSAVLLYAIPALTFGLRRDRTLLIAKHKQHGEADTDSGNDEQSNYAAHRFS